MVPVYGELAGNISMSMAIAGLSGISWYLGIELSISLFVYFREPRGLYFWSCALVSWGVILLPIFSLLSDYSVWQDKVPALTLTLLAWAMMVVPQSWVLYSRLHFLMPDAPILGVIKQVLIFTSIVIAVPTVVIGILAQATTFNPDLPRINLIWDRVQLLVFFIQETYLSSLYIFQTRKYLCDRAPLCNRRWSARSTETETANNQHTQSAEEKSLLWHLIFVNILIISLDIVVVGIQCADLFYLQGAFKTCVYAIKLRVEFSILNYLRDLVSQTTVQDIYIRSEAGIGETVTDIGQRGGTSPDVPPIECSTQKA
ncbi:integral membrane protein [Aspergillus heterothallicus]